MNRITIGLSKPNKLSSLFKNPDVFIEVPVARNVCISFYLIHITEDGTIIRLANRFYKDNKILFSKCLAISQDKERALIDWGKSQGSERTTQTLGKEIFENILRFKNTKSNKNLNTRNPYNLLKILQSIGEEKVKYSCVNFLKK